METQNIVNVLNDLSNEELNLLQNMVCYRQSNSKGK